MRKHQTLLTALALLLCSAVAAQAQNNLYEVKLFTTPTDARAGGENEMSGGVLLNFLTPCPRPLSQSLSITPSLSQAT